MRQEIEKLASEIFEKKELSMIHELISMYNGSDENYLIALGRLRYIIPSRPKRPMYYVHHRIGLLPEQSRFVVEQSGSYLDLLVKELRYELSGKYKGYSLGRNVNCIFKLKDSIDSELSIILNKILAFNKMVYVPAKHVYGPPNDYEHYFDVDDSIMVTLLAVKLGEEIKKRSQFARNMCQDLVLPGQGQISGNHPRTDSNGVPFDFTKSLFESKHLKLDIKGRVIN